MRKFAMLCATSALVIPGAAFAQSTGSIAVEDDAIVVTGVRTQDVNGISVPNTTRAQGVLNQEFIGRQAAGQSVLNTINLVPGVNFTNSDPYGSSGGNLRIRGFDGNRISLTFDGIPLNDSGNYAIFSNQQLDPELIEQVNVNLGQTEVDSPTASAAGGTVNYRTRLPHRDGGLRVSGSLGADDYRRLFFMVDTGEFWENGPRAFASYSNTRYDLFRGQGEIYKQQWNARIYYPFGSSGDFVSISGHYNRNRNNFYRNPSLTDLRNILGATVVPALVAAPLFPTADNPIFLGDYNDGQWDAIDRLSNFSTCTRTVGAAGVAQNDNGGRLPTGSSAAANTAPAVFGSTANNIENTSSCTNFNGLRINPSNTGNIRINGRFTLADNLLLTVDPSFQYVLANGGGTTVLSETDRRVRGTNLAAAGRDFNGDGDLLDSIRFYTPNNTNTRRLGLTTSLIWDITQDHRVRVAYTFDRARHRQTGEWGFLNVDGTPGSVFGGRGNTRPVLDATGFQIQQRDRLSIALLNQIAGQYIGNFFDDALRVELGLRVPFFRRDLDQRCFTEARGSGFAYCSSEIFPSANGIIIPPGGVVPLVPATPIPYYAPFRAEYSFNAVLPNAGIVYNFGGGLSAFASYARGFSAPRTDNLYRAPLVEIDPETTDSFDLGLRYRRRDLQAQATAWIINYSNRIVSSFNPDLGISLDRNVGRVESWGVDASVGWDPIPELSLFGLVSYINAELQENVQIGTLPAGVTSCNPLPTNSATFCAATAGRMVPETPEWTVGGRAQLNLGPVTIGAQAKWVDERFATDENTIVIDDYTVVDLDARFDLGHIGLPESFVQVNVTNLFDEHYFGNLSTQIQAGGNPNFSVGAPRTFMITLNIGWRAGR